MPSAATLHPLALPRQKGTLSAGRAHRLPLLPARQTLSAPERTACVRGQEAVSPRLPGHGFPEWGSRREGSREPTERSAAPSSAPTPSEEPQGLKRGFSRRLGHRAARGPSQRPAWCAAGTVLLPRGRGPWPRGTLPAAAATVLSGGWAGASQARKSSTHGALGLRALSQWLQQQQAESREAAAPAVAPGQGECPRGWLPAEGRG